jgi:hypothetical protein
MRSRSAAISFLSLISAACSSSPTATEACTDYASAYCALYSNCSNGFYLAETFGDVATCVSRVEINCDNRLALSSAQSAAATESCAQALPATSCADLYANDLPDACQAPDGGTENGGVCTISAQCQSSYCAIAKDALCGTCGQLPAAGDDCSVFPCGPRLSCLRYSGTCGVQASDGGPCLGEGDCQYGFACLEAFGDGGICVPAAASGEACDLQRLTGYACSTRLGLYCRLLGPGNGVCTALDQSDAGQPCGDVLDVATVCIQSGVCQKASPDAGSGTCLGYATDDAACDSDGGPFCLPLSRCIPATDGGTAGVCQQPAQMACQ